MSIIKHSIWNVAGYIIPAIATIPALAILGRTLGAEMFGIFTLALAIVGYASIFDVGLTRAVIREVSIYRYQEVEKLKIISTATIVVLILGIIASFLLVILSAPITTALKVTYNFHEQVALSLKIIALSIPLFLITQIWLAILEGEEKFGVLNIYKSITGTIITLLPALFVMIHPNLEYAVAGLVFSRFISLLITFFICRKQILAAGLNLNVDTMKRLFTFGGWITISNIISPIMSYFDRFIVSNQMGASVVAFYTAPSEIIARLGIIPAAFSRAVFPRLSFASTQEERSKNKKLMTFMLLAVGVPILLIGGFFSENIMVEWMGDAFSGTPAKVLTILLIGFFFNSLAQVPFASIQSHGYAKITAYIHLAELFPYLALIYFLINKMGVLGAAIAWSIRVIADYLILCYMDYSIEKRANI